jgi:hypothetical protein
MAINAASIPLLNLSAIGAGDLSSVLSPGESVRARVLDAALPGSAVIQIKGQNVTAQLPTGMAVVKGDILQLSVTQSSPAGIELKLVQNLSLSQAAAAGGGSAGASAPASPVLQWEAALQAAKLPVNSLNLAVARTLSGLGASLDPTALDALVKGAEGLLGNEQAVAGGPDPAVSQSLLASAAQLKVAAQLSPSSQGSVLLAQAARTVEAAVGENLNPTGMPAVEAAVAALSENPGPVQGLNLLKALESARGTGPSVSAADTAEAAGGDTSGSGLEVGATASRETVVQLLAGAGDAPTAGSLGASASALARALQDPSSTQSLRLLASVGAQVDGADASTVLADAQATASQAAAFFSAKPGDATVLSPRSELAQAGFAVPGPALSGYGADAVGEAVGWLGARGLPLARPVVESAAAWIAQGKDVLPSVRAALASSAGLEESLDTSMGLKQAYADLATALNHAGLDPSSEGNLSLALQSWPAGQGLTLENALSQGQAAVSTGLKPALAQVENQLHAAIAAVGSSSPQAPALNSALATVQAAGRAVNALPLQAQGAPSYDTVHLPLPVWMDGFQGDGRLSVTWRRGRERELDEKEPVSVAVSLNTEHLGKVQVHLQVWKNAAGVRVLAEDGATADFLKQGSGELKAGFAERTSFALRSLEFGAGEPEAKAPAFSGLEPPQTGLSLRA